MYVSTYIHIYYVLRVTVSLRSFTQAIRNETDDERRRRLPNRRRLLPIGRRRKQESRRRTLGHRAERASKRFPVHLRQVVLRKAVAQNRR